MKEKTLLFKVDKDFHYIIKNLAFEQDKSMSEICRLALKKYIDTELKPNGQAS